MFAHTEVYRNGSLCSHPRFVTSCVLECCLHPTTPPATHTHTHTLRCVHTHTYSTLDRPGCQSYTNSHPLAAGFQDNHGNQSLTPGETSSRTERLHSISTSQYSTHKRTRMHTFHTLTHSHWQTRTRTNSHAHTRTWTRPTQPTCSNSLAVTPAFPACLHWGEWELVRDRTLHPLTHGPRLHMHSTHQWNINYTSLIVIRHSLKRSWQTLYFMHKDDLSLPPEARSILSATNHCIGSHHLTASTLTWHVRSCLAQVLQGGKIGI